MQPGIDRRRDGSTKSIYVRCKRPAPGQMPARRVPAPAGHVAGSGRLAELGRQEEAVAKTEEAATWRP